MRRPRGFKHEFRRRGLRLEASRLLEIGCGTGYSTFAVAAAGAGEVVGVDLDLGGIEAVVERDLVRGVLLGDSPSRIRLERADAAALPFQSESFDAVFSFSALEHTEDLPAVLAELARVTRPGGVLLHVIDPWFSPQGGHSMCILDAPWAHVRLVQCEFERYVAELRPHEEAAAVDFYRHAFQRPRHTLAALRRLMGDSGFEVLDWDERRDAYANHKPLLAGLLAECSENHAGLAPADLLTGSLRVVLRRR